MVEERDSQRFKKGYVYAVANIPGSADITESLTFLTQTINKVIVVVQLTTGAVLTITGKGKFTFVGAGQLLFDAFQFDIIATGLAEAPAGNFARYDLNITTDVSTTGHVYMFFEYDYVLAK